MGMMICTGPFTTCFTIVRLHSAPNIMTGELCYYYGLFGGYGTDALHALETTEIESKAMRAPLGWVMG